MVQRRTFCSALAAAAGVLLASTAGAQRVTNPIARPPGERAVGALVKGQFGASGVAAGATPGVYVVLAVDAQDDTLQLQDDGGRTAMVHVNERAFDLGALKPGDEVEVDFLVPERGSTRLEAGGLWKVQR